VVQGLVERMKCEMPSINPRELNKSSSLARGFTGFEHRIFESLSRDAIFARIFAFSIITIKNRFHHADQGRKRPSNNMEHQGKSDRHV
jgi:hypothetical protein